jgi:hypothetical protein
LAPVFPLSESFPEPPVTFSISANASVPVPAEPVLLAGAASTTVTPLEKDE